MRQPTYGAASSASRTTSSSSHYLGEPRPGRTAALLALRSRTPRWWPPLLALGAVLFPIAHVANISWLAVADALVMLAALGTCGYYATDQVRASAGPVARRGERSSRQRIHV